MTLSNSPSDPESQPESGAAQGGPGAVAGGNAKRATDSAAAALPVAVIDIGATSVRMAIAEIRADGSVHPLDTLVQPVNLGKDAFTTRRFRRSTIEECVRVLLRYERVLREYGIDAERVHVVATSAVREAANRLTFLDRIYIATGLTVEPIDEAEVNRITYMGIQPQLEADPELATAKSVVVEVGGGSTEMLVVRSGNVLFSNTYRLGALRLAQTLRSLGAPAGKRQTLMESQIRRTVARIAEEVRVDMRLEMVALGGDMRFAARQLRSGGEDEEELVRIETAALARLANHVTRLSHDDVVHRYGISFAEAETLGPALLTYVAMASRFELDSVLVSHTNLRDGLLQDLASRGRWTAQFRNQIVRSAVSLGRKFDFDEGHAKQVAQLARKLFVELTDYHRLESRHEVLLHVAALLHEVGLFVNVRSNHKHAMYLIRNSDIFGLSRQDLLIVSLLARYHRRAFPQPSHEGYATLPREQRILVAKLAAILRLAVALDESRSGRVKEVICQRERNRLVIRVPGVDDVSLEQLSMRQNAGLFEEVFGMSVLLRSGA
jgi:exopolyphosphatase/guanosine-5'-triphosphate,3'-diphosphate pyrophosphatase